MVAEQGAGAAAPGRISSGTQSSRSFVQVPSSSSSSSRALAGTASFGTHRPWVSQHAFNVFAGSFGASQETDEHAPLGCPVSGWKHGAQRASAPHVDAGSRFFCSATIGNESGRHRPSESLTDRHEAGAAQVLDEPEGAVGAGSALGDSQDFAGALPISQTPVLSPWAE